MVNHRQFSLKIVRGVFAVAGILVCAFLAVGSAQHGLARYVYGAKGSRAGIPDFERALQLDENDPEPRLRLAAALAATDRKPEAVTQATWAVALRSRNYLSWLELGYARKINGDLNGACQAFAQAVQLAPHYGQPHWKLGKCLIDIGTQSEGDAELRKAMETRPSYTADVFRLVWDNVDGDANAFVAALTPDDPASKIAFARFLVSKSAWQSALPLYVAAPGQEADNDLRGLIRTLIDSKHYLDAYKVWQTEHPSVSDQCRIQRECIYESSFETTSKFEDTGFVWQLAKEVEGFDAVIDDRTASDGNRSLRVRFQGEPKLDAQLVSQLILVHPSTKYRLTFRAKTLELKSVAPPLISILDLGGTKTNDSGAIPRGTTDWQTFSVDFDTDDHTDVVALALRRAACKWSECPIFGSVWLDDFVLKRL